MAHRATAAVAGAGGVALSDAELVTLMRESNGLEIASGERALTTATDPAVRRFAQQMIDDHTKLQQAVERSAQEHGSGRRPARAAAPRARGRSRGGCAVQAARPPRAEPRRSADGRAIVLCGAAW
jgi:predicted outer membrane protein